MKRQILLSLLVLLALVSSGCDLLDGGDGSGGGSTEPPAAELLPMLAGYNTVEGQQLTDYISTLSGGAALLAGQPELAVTVAAVDQVIGCYQDVGAVRARAYSNQAAPLSAGAVAIADQEALLDPVNFFNCVALRPQAKSPLAIEPCAANYTLEQGDKTFYVLYAGTTADICQAFCTNLAGCTAHP